MTKLTAISRSSLTNAITALTDGGQDTDIAQFVEHIIEHMDTHPVDDATDNRIYPTYSTMILRLFKQLPEMPHASTLHAAVGISGEVAELVGAYSRKNIIEECGDLEFYIEALKQRFEPDYLSALEVQDSRVLPATFTSVSANLISVAGDILDIVKKSWVYGKDLDVVALTRYIVVLQINMDVLYNLIDTTSEQVQHLNQVKLIGPGGRFESGFYSDAAAIARNDKVSDAGADRSFMGKV